MRMISTFIFLCLIAIGLCCLEVPPARAEDPFTKPEFIIPEQGADLSARRLDSEIVGWDKTFDHLAAIGVDTVRQRDGRHQGNVFLWVFPMGEMLPTTKVRLHHISHAPHPHDPIPIEDARDLTWTIETPLLWRWPKRPIRKPPKHAMKIKPFWYFTEQNSQLCNIYVGASLIWKTKKKMLPARPLDLTVACSSLQYTDHRLYWGKDNIAGLMIRYDFPKQLLNERSARFIVPISWQHGQIIRCSIESDEKYFNKLSEYFTPFTQHISKTKTNNSREDKKSLIKATQETERLARHISQMLGDIPVQIESQLNDQTDIILIWEGGAIPQPDFNPKQPRLSKNLH